MEVSGISFIVRIRDEEDVLYDSISSLKALTIPHEIILILHLCIDSSPQIAEKLANENPNIRVIFYNHEVSKAGYETLATDADSDHSFVKYSNWCFNLKKYPWVFKWDADFLSSEGLIKFLNENNWEQQIKNYKINCKNEEMNNCENYLMGGLINYVKFMFWETPCMYVHGEEINDPEIFITHVSKLSKIKIYWKRQPWYENEDSEEATIVKNRILRLTTDFGKEPIGLARASNKECDPFTINISNIKPDYVNILS